MMAAPFQGNLRPTQFLSDVPGESHFLVETEELDFDVQFGVHKLGLPPASANHLRSELTTKLRREPKASHYKVWLKPVRGTVKIDIRPVEEATVA